jgi:hypothetical protein
VLEEVREAGTALRVVLGPTPYQTCTVTFGVERSSEA